MKRVPARQYPDKNLDRNLDRNLTTGVALADLAPLGQQPRRRRCPRLMKTIAAFRPRNDVCWNIALAFREASMNQLRRG